MMDALVTLVARVPARVQANAAPNYDADVDEDEPLAPPSPPARSRYSDIYQRGDSSDRGYAPRDYGPPPGWQRDWRDYPPPPHAMP